MNIRNVRAGAIVPAILLALLLPAGAALAEGGDYAPENIEKTDKFLSTLCYIHALCPLSDEKRALIKRAMAGKPSAEYLLALNLFTGDGFPTDRDAGLAWEVRAAEHGDPDAARDIAGKLRNGVSIQIDETKVANALKPQAEAGDLDSMRALAPMLMGGRGTAQDPSAGLAMLKRAAEKGSSGAEQDLSNLYMSGGPGVGINRPEAIKWIGVSARHGNIDAMLSLGYMSVGGPGDIRNLTNGYCWLMRAALLDHPQAHEKLSMMFASGEKDDHGVVVPVDLVQADLWFRLAARSPYHNNSQIRSMIEPKMTTAQIEEAKRLVDGWHKRTVEELKTLAIPLPASGRNCPAMT